MPKNKSEPTRCLNCGNVSIVKGWSENDYVRQYVCKHCGYSWKDISIKKEVSNPMRMIKTKFILH